MPMYLIEPPLQRVKLKQLRPTQMTVGFKEVQRKHDKWAQKSGKKRADFISEMIFPTVIGPGDQLYILDRPKGEVRISARDAPASRKTSPNGQQRVQGSQFPCSFRISSVFLCSRRVPASATARVRARP